MKTVSIALAHGIPDGVSKKKDRGWTVYPRGDGTGFGISFRIEKGVWRDRRIPRDEARTEPQAERWARANVERLRAGEPTVRAASAVPAVVRVRDLEDPFLKVRATMGLRPATLKQDASTLRAHIIPRIGNLVASEVNVATLLVFVDKLKAAGLSASTIRNVLSVVRCLFDVSAARQLAPIVVNPTRDPVFIRQGRPKRTRSPKVQVAIEVVEKVLTHDDVPEHWKLRILEVENARSAARSCGSGSGGSPRSSSSIEHIRHLTRSADRACDACSSSRKPGARACSGSAR